MLSCKIKKVVFSEIKWDGLEWSKLINSLPCDDYYLILNWYNFDRDTQMGIDKFTIWVILVPHKMAQFVLQLMHIASYEW